MNRDINKSSTQEVYEQWLKSLEQNGLCLMDEIIEGKYYLKHNIKVYALDKKIYTIHLIDGVCVTFEEHG